MEGAPQWRSCNVVILFFVTLLIILQTRKKKKKSQPVSNVTTFLNFKFVPLKRKMTQKKNNANHLFTFVAVLKISWITQWRKEKYAKRRQQASGRVIISSVRNLIWLKMWIKLYNQITSLVVFFHFHFQMVLLEGLWIRLPHPLHTASHYRLPPPHHTHTQTWLTSLAI